MTGFGGLCPLPLRLGGDSETGWTSAQYLAAASDVLSCLRSVPFARVRVAGGVVVAYRGLNGAGLACAPTITNVSTSVWQLSWPSSYDDDAEDSHVVGIQAVLVTPVGSASVALAPSIALHNNVVVVGGDDFIVTVWASGYERKLSDYEAYLDKEDTKTEIVPYAWSSYRALQDARGSAYSTARSGLVHVENLALARGHAARWRDAERLSSNANPATASELQSDWQKVLGVAPRADDTPESIRSRCAAKFQVTLGPTQQVDDDAIAALLGRFFVRTWRTAGTDLDAPPALTYWPGVNPGPPGWDLGGGTWISERSHLFVEVTQLGDSDLVEFNAKIEQLTELLDRTLPAHMTWNWGTGADDGFVLDEDLLDEGTLAP